MITWTSKGRAHPGEFTVHVPNNPAAAWATGVLSESYGNLSDYMNDSQQRARSEVRALSRVDTGLMRFLTESFLSEQGHVFELDFGWWEGSPHYAPYQEFGTRYIEPMLAVYRVHLEIASGIPGAVVGR